jgi:hypothetical protein
MALWSQTPARTSPGRAQSLPGSNSTPRQTRASQMRQPSRVIAVGLVLVDLPMAWPHRCSRGLPGGAEGIRTPDLCSAIAALSQPPDVRASSSLASCSDAGRTSRARSGGRHFDLRPGAKDGDSLGQEAVAMDLRRRGQNRVVEAMARIVALLPIGLCGHASRAIECRRSTSNGIGGLGDFRSKA